MCTLCATIEHRLEQCQRHFQCRRQLNFFIPHMYYINLKRSIHFVSKQISGRTLLLNSHADTFSLKITGTGTQHRSYVYLKRRSQISLDIFQMLYKNDR
jgi:hypothetical protein